MDPMLDESVVNFLKGIGVGIRPIHDPFFDDSYRICKVFQKTGVTVEDDEDLCHPVMKDFICNAPGCQARFDNLLNFEVHYNSTHRYTCTACKKIKPTARLLEIHIQETHDSFFEIMSKKQPMFQCYVSDCNIKFMNSDIRREHCLHIHKFPKNFKYDGASRKKIKEKANEYSADLMEIDQLTNNLSISKKSTISLDKNQKIKTFLPHLKNMNKTMNESQPLIQLEAPVPKTISSSLVFIPRQLTHKPSSKVLTQDKSIDMKDIQK